MATFIICKWVSNLIIASHILVMCQWNCSESMVGCGCCGWLQGRMLAGQPLLIKFPDNPLMSSGGALLEKPTKRYDPKWNFYKYHFVRIFLIIFEILACCNQVDVTWCQRTMFQDILSCHLHINFILFILLLCEIHDFTVRITQVTLLRLSK